MDGESSYLTVPEAAKLIGVPGRTIVHFIREGELPAVYISSRVGWRIRREAFDRWLKDREQTGKASK